MNSTLSLDFHQAAPLPGVLANPNARAFLFGMAAATVGTSLSNAEATAVDVTTPLQGITRPICQVYNALTGVLGIGFILTLLAFAGLKYASGNNKATSQAVAAVVGAIIVFSARSLLSLGSGATDKIKSACDSKTNSKFADPTGS